jgi:hypothetical protein
MKKVLLKTFTPIFAFLLIIGAFSVNVKAAGSSTKDATDLSSGEGVMDSLLNGDDVNYYKFTVNGNGYFTISFSGDPNYDSGKGWRVKLCNSSMEVITYFVTETTGETEKLFYAEGTFYVTVEGAERSWNDSLCPTGVPYTIKYNKVNDDSWESEDNNTASNADVIATGRMYKGVISSVNDSVDYYKVTTSKQGYFTVQLGLADGEEPVGQTDGWRMDIYDKNMQNIVSYNHIKSDFETMIPYPAGIYYIKISPTSKYSNSVIPRSAYYLLVNDFDDSLVEQESNNDSAGANDIVPGVGRWGMRQSDNDNDYYKFIVSNSGVFTVSLAPRAGADTTKMGNGWDVIVYDKNMKEVFRENIVKDAYETDPIFYTSGTYYVNITGSATGVEYDVNVNIPAKTDYYSKYDGCLFFKSSNGTVFCYREDGKQVINEFKCDGEYTYYFQADGTAMKDRLTYHPDGVHVIYFDKDGHEVFSDFAHISKSIAGTDVDDMCFFNVYGYMYVDTLTYDKTGTKLYYVNPYGVLERNGWFQFSGHEFEAGLGFSGKAGGYGYANSDCSLSVNETRRFTDGTKVYMQGDGHMAQ